MTKDEPYPEGFEEQYEVVDHSEPEEEHPDKSQKFDEFGAPIRPVVKIVDGVRDSRRR